MKKFALILENNIIFNNIWNEYFKNELNFDVKIINHIKPNVVLSEEKISCIIFNSSKEHFLKIEAKLELINKPVFVLVDSYQDNNFKQNFYYYEKPLNLNAFNRKIKEALSNKNKRKIKTHPIGIYSLDINKKQLLNKENEVLLRFTDKEVLILNEILRSKDSGINKTDLLNKVWNYSEKVETKTVETTIYRLRKKLSRFFNNKDIILNVEKKYKINI